MKRSAANAFTLIELLVVVAIIVALIAILLPSLNKATAAAQSVVCASNQRQLGNAFRMHVYDNGRKFFPIIEAAPSYWFHLISDELGADGYATDPVRYRKGPMEVLHCPTSEANPRTVGFELGTAMRDWVYLGGTGSYGLNMWMTPNGAWYTPASADRPQANFFQGVTDVTRASTTPIFADSQWVGAWPSENDYVPANFFDPTQYNTLGSFMSRFTMDRHDMAVNVAFFDGSSGRVEILDLWNLSWHRNWSAGSPTTP